MKDGPCLEKLVDNRVIFTANIGFKEPASGGYYPALLTVLVLDSDGDAFKGTRLPASIARFGFLCGLQGGIEM